MTVTCIFDGKRLSKNVSFLRTVGAATMRQLLTIKTSLSRSRVSLPRSGAKNILKGTGFGDRITDSAVLLTGLLVPRKVVIRQS